MTDWLAPAVAYIPQWLDYQVAQLGLPGASLAIAQNGAVALAHAVGVADLNTGAPLTPAHRFRVASHSKTFTAAGILRLVDAGRLRLDDRAGTHVAGLHPEIARATVSQLLSHTGGIIRDGEDAGQWLNRRPFLDEAELRAALVAPPTLPPNTRMKYTNHGFGLLGLIIAAVTGERYNSWIAREIVATAGLAETCPDAPLPVGAPLASGHAAPAMLGRRFVVPADTCTNGLASATGFVSTPSDLTRFFSQLTTTSSSALLSLESRRELARPLWRIPGLTATRHYGLGTAHGETGPWTWFGHGGGFPGVRSFTVVVPDQAIAVSVCLHATDGEPQAMVENILRMLQTFAERGPADPALSGWAGRFWSLWGASDFVPMGREVVVAQPSQGNPFADPTVLAPSGPDTATIIEANGYGSYGQSVRLIRDTSGSVTEVLFAGSLLKQREAAAEEARARYGA